MKKILFIIIVVMVSLLSGCTSIGSGYLEKKCAKVEGGSVKRETTYVISFKNNIISKTVLKETYIFDDNELKNNMLKGFKDLKASNKYDGVSIKTSDIDNSCSIEYTFELKTIDKEVKEKYHLNSKYNKQESILVDLGYTCN